MVLNTAIIGGIFILCMEDLTINNNITIRESVLTFRFSRSSGKGGQNVNKVSTKVELLLNVNDIEASDEIKERVRKHLSHRLDSFDILRIVSQESRSQWQNKKSAVQKLIDLIADASLEEKERKATKRTRSSHKERLEKKKLHSRRKAVRQTKHFDDE